MPAVTVDNPLVLPRLTEPRFRCPGPSDRRVVSAHHAIEGAGFEVWRPFPGGVDAHIADPFFLLDQLGPVDTPPTKRSAPRGIRTAVSRRSPTSSTASSSTTTRTGAVA